MQERCNSIANAMELIKLGPMSFFPHPYCAGNALRNVLPLRGGIQEHFCRRLSIWNTEEYICITAGAAAAFCSGPALFLVAELVGSDLVPGASHGEGWTWSPQCREQPPQRWPPEQLTWRLNAAFLSSEKEKNRDKYISNVKYTDSAEK